MKPRVLLVLIAALLLCARNARADGGRLRFRQMAGPFIVTLFTTPDPLTTGRADFSVAVEREGHTGLVENAKIEIVLKPIDGQGHALVVRASHGAATSKWLQAANFRFPSRGVWRVKVIVRRGDDAGTCYGRVRVAAGGARDLGWDIFPVPLVGLFLAFHEMRKRKFKDSQKSRRNQRVTTS